MKNFYCEETLKFMSLQALPYEVETNLDELRKPTDDEKRIMQSIFYAGVLELNELIGDEVHHGAVAQKIITDTCAYTFLTLLPSLHCNCIFHGLGYVFDTWDKFVSIDDAYMEAKVNEAE